MRPRQARHSLKGPSYQHRDSLLIEMRRPDVTDTIHSSGLVLSFQKDTNVLLAGPFRVGEGLYLKNLSNTLL